MFNHSSKPHFFIIFIVIISLFAGALGGAGAVIWGAGFLNLPSNQNSSIINNLRPSSVKIQEESATTSVVSKVSPSVVSIIISKDVAKLYNSTGPNTPFDGFFGQGSPFNFFFGNQIPQPAPRKVPQGKQTIGGGTGFVIDSAKGLILTNRHVVDDTEADYTVLTNDGKKYEAKVLIRDSGNDLAIVQIKDAKLPALEFGDSDKIQIGQTVIAIGNALGEYRNTVTKGVISGTARNVVAGDSQGSSESLEGVFQTDAAINPGNSGGPLVNLSGQVIGINTAVNREGQLIGFAIPSNEAKRLVDNYQKYGKVVRPYLGIRYVLVTPEMARANDLPVDYGALVVRGQNDNTLAVVPGSPADKAGLVENDIVLEADGKKISTEQSLVKILSRYKPGDTVKLKIYHKGEQKDVAVKLGEFKE